MARRRFIYEIAPTVPQQPPPVAATVFPDSYWQPTPCPPFRFGRRYAETVTYVGPILPLPPAAVFPDSYYQDVRRPPYRWQLLIGIAEGPVLPPVAPGPPVVFPDSYWNTDVRPPYHGQLYAGFMTGSVPPPVVPAAMLPIGTYPRLGMEPDQGVSPTLGTGSMKVA